MAGLATRPFERSAHWLKRKRNCFQCSSLSWGRAILNGRECAGKSFTGEQIDRWFSASMAEVMLARPADVPLQCTMKRLRAECA